MSRVSWQMGAEVKCKQEPATVEITVEEFQALIETKVKLDVITRHLEDNRYMSRDEFHIITGFEITKEENNGDTV